MSTTAGDLELRIPKLRSGSLFPALLERRRRVDQCLFAVVMETYLHGTSTRKVDDLVKALGADSGISKSQVSRICADLDTEVAAFRDRPLSEQRFPYVFLDATSCKARVNHRVVSQAVVIATGVAADGRREVLGFDVDDSEDGAFWTAFLRSLKLCGLTGVQLVISGGKRSGIPTRKRLNKEIKRRTDVVGVFPEPAPLLRLASSVLVEAHDEWQVADKRYRSETTLALLDAGGEPQHDVAANPDSHGIVKTCRASSENARPTYTTPQGAIQETPGFLGRFRPSASVLVCSDTASRRPLRLFDSLGHVAKRNQQM